MSVLVNKQAPDFDEKAIVSGENGYEVVDSLKLSSYLGKYVILFFYPLDFTFVCPTELHAFQEKLDEFKKKNCEIVGCSTDSWYSHLAWLNTEKKDGGIKGIKYPIIADFNKTIAQDYDVLLDGGMALRGLFLIDKEGIVQHQVVNNLDLGRSVNEAIRVLDALQYTEKYGEVCPANWEQGKEAMTANSEGLKTFFDK